MTACVRVPDAAGRREPHLAEFATTVRAWWPCATGWPPTGVTHVAMEATGVYWQPVWHILEDEFELTLCNARHVKNVPGRKTDVSDAQWLCQLMEAGLSARQLRAAEAPAAAAHPDPLPQDPDRRARARGQPAAQGARGHRHQARLRGHATSWAPPGGRCWTRSVAGTTDPIVLAELAKGRLRGQDPRPARGA